MSDTPPIFHNDVTNKEEYLQSQTWEAHPTTADFPTTGATEVLYLARNAGGTPALYEWNGSSYVTTGFGEAPSDGQTYGRASGAWHVINPQNVTLPTITGPAAQVSTLTDANTDTWTGAPTSFLRQWQRGSGVSWTNISGATASTYTLVLADVGYQIRMIKSAVNSVGQSLPFSEATPTAVVTTPLNAITLHFNGSSGSTSFPDTSGHSITVAALGNAQITTADSVFGGACLTLDGTTGTGASFPSLAISTGDFTIEFRFRTTGSQPPYAQLIGNEISSSGFVLLLTAGGISLYRAAFVNIAGGLAFSTSATSYGDGAWHCAALVRSSGVLTLYIDGVADGGTGADTSDITGGSWAIGTSLLWGGRNFVGNIDEFRVTPVAQYLSNYTPATSEFVP